MSLSSDISDILETFGKTTVKDLDTSLLSKVSKGGGYNPRLRKDIKYEFRSSSTSIQMAIVMPKYGLAVDGGRKPSEKGSEPGELKKNLESWIKRKGIKPNISKLKTAKLKTLKNKTVRKSAKQVTYDKAVKNLAFVFARKIHREGYKGNNFIKEVVKDGRVEELQNKLSELIKTDIIINIV
jgi:hypothetical protein